jgi:hypothetical protein
LGTKCLASPDTCRPPVQRAENHGEIAGRAVSRLLPDRTARTLRFGLRSPARQSAAPVVGQFPGRLLRLERTHSGTWFSLRRGLPSGVEDGVFAAPAPEPLRHTPAAGQEGLRTSRLDRVPLAVRYAGRCVRSRLPEVRCVRRWGRPKRARNRRPRLSAIHCPGCRWAAQEVKRGRSLAPCPPAQGRGAGPPPPPCP